MSKEFWLGLWQNEDALFDQQEVNQWLLKYQNELGNLHGKNVFVPLCGKSIDMMWLYQQGARVTGVELSEIAAQQFFEENELNFEVTKVASFTIYHQGNIQIMCGDFFELTHEHMPDINLVYDRAALIALPEKQRQRYVEHMTTLHDTSALIFLISIQYELDKIELPPYSINPDEIKTLYSQDYEVKLLEQKQLTKVAPHLVERGIEEIIQSVYLTRRR